MKTRTLPDLCLLACLAILFTIGSFTLYAALHQGDLNLLYRQLVHWLIGAIVLGVALFIPVRRIAQLTWPLYLFTLLLLVLVPFIGEINMGARRWLNLGIFQLQPSDPMKWVMVLTLAFVLSANEPRQYFLLFRAMAISLLPASLVLIQPDLGTAILLLAAAGVMIIVAGMPGKWLIVTLILIPAAMPIMWQQMHDYQRQRVLGFLNPESDPLGAGYHVIQSTIAIGSGGLFGKGYLNGTQAKLHFLPEQHTDFIFAVLAEENGILGAMALLIVYTIFIGRILMIASQSYSRFGSIVCLGIATLFTLYISVNLGMVMGLLPVVGIPLPFISYGGSALVTMLAATGLVMRIHMESQHQLPWQRSGSPMS